MPPGTAALDSRMAPDPHPPGATSPHAERDVLRDARASLVEQVHEALDGVMVLLSAAWIGLLVVELAGGGLPRSLEAAVWIIWAIFGLDFLLEFAIAPAKRAYLRSHWLTAVSLVLPAVRILRLASALRFLRAARVVRGVGLLRLVTTINRGLASLRATAARRGVGYVVAATALVMVVGAAGMAFFEAPGSLSRSDAPGGGGSPLADYGEAFWWTAYAMTTGPPQSPLTGEGKLLGWLLSLYGLAVFGYLTATLASHFIERDRAVAPTTGAPSPGDVDQAS